MKKKSVKIADKKERDNKISYDELIDYCESESYIRACELDSPNSPDFQRAKRKIFEQMFDELYEDGY